MKTRIKVVTKNSGEITYIPQLKGFDEDSIVFYIFPILGQLILIRDLFFYMNMSKEYSNLEDCKKKIDIFITEIKNEDMEKYKEKIKQVNYIKYP